jgi:hypothetical protein
MPIEISAESFIGVVHILFIYDSFDDFLRAGLG